LNNLSPSLSVLSSLDICTVDFHCSCVQRRHSLRQAHISCLCAVLGKVEGEGALWHGHVTAVTVASDCRRLGLATKLMNILEDTTERVYEPLQLRKRATQHGGAC
jgi:ribosomal protein S18 acetylase RimI-like enzyme